MNDMISLRNDYKLCEKELASMKSDQRPKGLPRSTSSKVTKGSELVDPRKALFAAILSRGPKEDDALNQPPLFSAIKNRRLDNDERNDDDSPETDVEYSPGVYRLQKFLIHSKSILSIADEDLNAAIRACKVSFTRNSPRDIHHRLEHSLMYFSFLCNFRVLQYTVERMVESDPQRRSCRC